MISIHRTDSVFRRQIVLVLVVGALVGALLIVAFEQYQIPLRNWILSDPEALAQRVKVAFLLLAAFLMAPLLALAVYLWSLGGRVLRAREFPPPGLRVIHDTPVITGEAAISRGRLLKVFAFACGIVSVALGLLLWRLAPLLSGHAV